MPTRKRVENAVNILGRLQEKSKQTQKLDTATSKKKTETRTQFAAHALARVVRQLKAAKKGIVFGGLEQLLEVGVLAFRRRLRQNAAPNRGLAFDQRAGRGEAETHNETIRGGRAKLLMNDCAKGRTLIAKSGFRTIDSCDISVLW